MTRSKMPLSSGGEPELRSVGLKATLPRMQVLEIFRQSASRHLHAEDVFRLLAERRAEVGLATVYRVLSQLEAAGLLLRQTFESGKAVFELNEGPHHDHLICLQCGRVDEFSNDHIEALQHQVAQAHGYRLADHRLALYGHCGACSQLPPESPAQPVQARQPALQDNE
ncbi:ferric iron uptake transcriptional regulator [Delftia acidovorans]|uniref:Ferric uptake regulation protein n=2 Tax=Pseudomonadati TaxID=3379134 RepID=A0A2G7T2H1_9FLAO|nr:ferric iron uptake transcriptional regulator [Delftia acidovorans]